MDPDGRARALAARQNGILHYDQLIRCGLSRKQVAGRVARGQLLAIHHHVLLVAGATLTFQARVQAALLACGSTTFASHMTAAVLWGIRRHAPDVVDVTVPQGSPRRLQGVRVHRLRSAAPTSELRTRHGLRISAPARTICELAATEDRQTVEYAIQEAAANLRLTPDELGQAADRWGRRPGAAMLHAILGDEGKDGFGRSQAERQLRRILRAAKLRLPDHTNLVIHGHRCDAVWHDIKLVVEIDGIGTHGTPVAFAADRAMDTELTLAGWRVIRFTARQLRDHPLQVAAQLALALQAGGA